MVEVFALSIILFYFYVFKFIKISNVFVYLTSLRFFIFSTCFKLLRFFVLSENMNSGVVLSKCGQYHIS